MGESIELISRKEANRLGLKQYFTGKPCKYGHIDRRTVSNGVCMECSRIKALKRMRENPEARKKSRECTKRRYREDEEYRERVKARAREWHHNNKDRASENKKRWYRENAEIARASNRDRWNRYREDPEWVERERARKRKEREEYPHRWVASYNARRAREKAVEGKVTAKQIIEILESQGRKCVYCQVSLDKGYEVDHIMPLALGGTNWPSNIQCLCRSCNRRKSSKHPDDFAKEMGLQ